MAIPEQARQETLGDRFDAMYATASAIQVYEGPVQEPEINSRTPVTEIGDTGVFQSSSLYRGSSGLFHLTTHVSLRYGGQPYQLFTFTASSQRPTDLAEFQPTRVAGFRGGESEGDYALARDLSTNKPGLVAAYLGNSGLPPGLVSLERVSGNLTGRTSSKVDELPEDKRQLLGLVTAGISVSVGAANMALGGTETPVILEYLGRHPEAATEEPNS